MCSVGGVLIFGNGWENAREHFLRIVGRSISRGRDSWGVVFLRDDGSFVSCRGLGPPSGAGKCVFSVDGVRAAIFNLRAEPTTEHVSAKTEDDIQPMVGEYVAVSHNGTIANDRELEARFGLGRRSRIDAAVLPPLLERVWDGSLEGLRHVLVDLVVGSYALAVLDRRRPGRLWLATNFKPLYLMWDGELGALFFASYDAFLEEGGPIWRRRPLMRLEPYTALEVGVDGTWRETSLWRRDEVRRVLVVASGGLDSTTAAAKLKRDGYEVALLHFNYRHVAEDREREAVRRIADALGVPLIEVDTDFFARVGSSPLLGEGEISDRNGGMGGAEYAHEWVPARNFVFVALAVALAEAWGFDAVALGVNLEEAGAYPDNEPEFYRLLNGVLPYATGPQRRVRLMMPVGELVKHEIVRLGLEVGAPLHHTWSCYRDGPTHCGRCGPCYMRRVAFRINGVRDPVPYDLPPEVEEEFWRGAADYWSLEPRRSAPREP